MGFGRLLPASLCVLTLALIGCGAGPLNSGSNPIGNSQYSGSVHGGQQPVVGATIQLYTVGTTADGSAATPLLTSTVTSGPDRQLHHHQPLLLHQRHPGLHRRHRRQSRPQHREPQHRAHGRARSLLLAHTLHLHQHQRAHHRRRRLRARALHDVAPPPSAPRPPTPPRSPTPSLSPTSSSTPPPAPHPAPISRRLHRPHHRAQHPRRHPLRLHQLHRRHRRRRLPMRPTLLPHHRQPQPRTHQHHSARCSTSPTTPP